MKSLKPIIFLIVGFGFTYSSFAKEPEISNYNKSNYSISIMKTSEKVEIDGILEEQTWTQAKVISGFYQHYPKDDVPADVNTEVKISYDNKYLYISAVCHEANSKPLIQTLRRDDMAKLSVSDGFSVVIDAINSDKNGYFFGVNAAGSQTDGMVSQSGGQPQVDANWDNVWYSEVKQTGTGYTVEMAIPFNSLKYQLDNTRWGINFTRNDMKRGVYYVWTKFPVNIDGIDLTYNGEIEFVQGVPKQQGGKIEFFPAISGKRIEDFENNKNPEYKLQGGLDAKMGLGSSMNLNLSVMPDFSTVQVDQQYIDFFPYEYYVPEQRIFFLENNDLFTNYGSAENFITPGYAYKIKPFYSRRIAIKDWEYYTMYYGVRLSGNMNENLRIGLMNVLTAEYEEMPSQSYSVATLQQSVLKNSSVRGLFIDRESITGIETGEQELGVERFNRNAGLEFDYITPDNKWSLLTKYHHSFSPPNYVNSNYYGATLIYNSNTLRMQHVFNHVDENYIADVGYVPRLYQRDDSRDTSIRKGYSQLMSNIIYQFRNGKHTSFQGTYFNVALYVQPWGTLNEVQQEIGYYIQFNNRSSVYSGFSYYFLDMLYPYDVLKNDKPLPPQTYEYYKINIGLNSDPRKKLNVGLYGEYGPFYNGNKLFLEIKSEFRIQPWATFQLTYDYCDLKFPVEYGSATYHLVTGKTEIGLSRKMIWTTLMQYNTQWNNFNINSMLQWRFRPLSDFYIVIKDDMDIENSKQKKLQVVFKLTYWFRI